MLEGVKLCVGNNVTRLFSFLYIAASHTVHVHFCVCVYIVSCHIYILCITFLNMFPLIFFYT